ncbi:hypothetical protein EVAR_83283_1 [Eumeta japonica]|uniref:Uncharacterized protein n=1 Tax=Eumeta variegata TaxID=151549 RepID=A0A4C1XAZ3_EUMVA|nr:hypothetical protein EVAR_83283_1 [Eumeta japonica]
MQSKINRSQSTLQRYVPREAPRKWGGEASGLRGLLAPKAPVICVHKLTRAAGAPGALVRSHDIRVSSAIQKTPST